MKGAVIYSSKYGNTRKVAEEIARGLAEAGQEAEVLEAKKLELPADLDFVVVGSPTRMGKMEGSVKKFIKKGIPGGYEGKPFAAFGCGFKADAEKGKKQSAEDIDEALTEKGLSQACAPLKVGVEGMEGPLGEGDLEKAFQFGKDLGSKLST